MHSMQCGDLTVALFARVVLLCEMLTARRSSMLLLLLKKSVFAVLFPTTRHISKLPSPNMIAAGDLGALGSNSQPPLDGFLDESCLRSV